MMTLQHLSYTAGIITFVGTALITAQTSDRPAAKDDSKRPKLVLRAQPSVAIAPARLVLTAELQGGADDFEDYYCPSIEWKWGDDTSSESSMDCAPYEPGKSQIKRRFTVQHTFSRDGAYKVYFQMKRNDKILATASTAVQIQPGSMPQF